MMRILHLLSQRPDATGSGIYVQAMLREARAKGHQNFLVAGIDSHGYDLADDIDGNACSFVEFNGEDLPFPIVGMSDVMPYPSRRFRDLTPEELNRYHRCFEGRIQIAVDRFRPDILHSHHLWLMTALIRHLVPDLPLVTSCHGTDLRQFETCPHLQDRVRPAVLQLDAVLALSRIQREEILAMHGLSPERVWVTGAGFREDLFRMPGPKPLSPPVRLIYAGKLCRAKGLPNLLRALAAVQDLPWHLTVAGGGSGPEQEECLQLIHTLGDRVRYIGSVPQPALALAMQKAHVFILSSFFEGLPLVLLEAMACGCRVIATEVPGVRELFETDFSPWVKTLPTPPLQQLDKPLPGTEGAFEDHLAVLLRIQIQAVLDAPAIPAQEIRRFLEPFTWPRVFSRIERVYQNLIADPPPINNILILFVLFLIGCIGIPENVRPVDNFKIEKYLGNWYEIARLDHSFERGLTQVTADYRLRDDGGVSVVNRGYSAKENSWKEAKGKAYFVKGSDHGYLKVSFFGPFYGSYIVFELDQENYQYSLVCGSNKSYLWVLARSPTIKEDIKNILIEKAAAAGFETSKLIFVDHDKSAYNTN